MPEWTKAQSKAIYEPSQEGNILVSAAAGSGKTAVLVERIVNMITRMENPVSVDELLIVTFTEAAAAEMKERIISRMSAAYRDALGKGDYETCRRMKEQIHLTAGADIETIDAFCLNVIRNNFHVLGIDPDFSIMDKNEAAMLTDDTLDELFLSLYASEDETERNRFLRLVEIYSSNRDDEGLKSIVRKIYNFIQPFPDMKLWLDEKGAMYSADMTKSVWAREVFFKNNVKQILDEHREFWTALADEMKKDAQGEDAAVFWGKLWQNVQKCAEACESLANVSDLDELSDFYHTYIKKKSVLGNAVKKGVPQDKLASDEQWQKYYNMYDTMRDSLRESCIDFGDCSCANFNNAVHAPQLKEQVDDIIWLVKKFIDSFEEKKNKKNEKSFSDIEHLAYKLFSENENIRCEYAARYREILIDEYQDTNGLQDAIFTLISRENKNMFLVGDLKQSIYRFRGGDPSIFKKKNGEYAKERGGKRIILSDNFRSRREVLDGINAVFGAVMSDSVGDVDYSGEEMLRRDIERECYPKEDGAAESYKPELYCVAALSGEDGEITAERVEAAFIADKIQELVEGHFKVYTGDGKCRDIEYGDIVILMRSVKSDGDTVRDMLETRGISAFVQKEEYFERREIKLMLSLISLINNHMQDIPLTAVMRSPIGNFTDNDLAKIKLNYDGKSFYKAVKKYKNDGGDERLRSRCADFIANLDKWRGYVKLKSIASLIWTLYEETGFYDFMGALEGGEEAQANLKLLYERAKRYEASEFRGVFNFIRYIERIEKRNEDISGAQTANDAHNAVRIMTIHKSKGLEFPVVFLARTTKQLRASHPNEETRIHLHKELGLGVDYYNYEDMYRKELVFRKTIGEKNTREYFSEEMRLLYVAMTRAKEKLIVTAVKTCKTEEDCKLWLENARKNDYKIGIRYIKAKKAGCYADWIIPSAYGAIDLWQCSESVTDAIEYEECKKEEEIQIQPENEDSIREGVRRILEYSYAYPESGAIPSKTSVTAIKEMEDAEHVRDKKPLYMVKKPKFMRDKKTKALQTGTAHHQVMAYINIEEIRSVAEADYEDFVLSEIERICNEGQLDREIANDKEKVKEICRNICGFFESDMGKKVLASKNVFRERPFEILISAREYDTSLPERCKDDLIVVQGIIDLYFEDENGSIILVDYKTDHCKTEEEQLDIADKYKRQVNLYASAIEKILKKPVKDKYLYLFSVDDVVKLD